MNTYFTRIFGFISNVPERRSFDANMSLTRILLGRLFISALEELDGGISSDAVLLRQLGLLGGVHLAQADVRTLGLQQTSGLGVLRSQGLAVAAPWCICGAELEVYTCSKF